MFIEQDVIVDFLKITIGLLKFDWRQTQREYKKLKFTTVFLSSSFIK